MGRWKLSDQGGYWDPTDTGPDQFTPQAGQQYPGQPQQPPSQLPMGGQAAPDAGPGGMTGRPPLSSDFSWSIPPLKTGRQPWSETMPDGNGGYYNPGGHFDANGNPLPGRGASEGGYAGPSDNPNGGPQKQYPFGTPLQPQASGPLDLLTMNYGNKGGFLGRVVNSLNNNPAAAAQFTATAKAPPSVGALSSLLHSPFGIKR